MKKVFTALFVTALLSAQSFALDFAFRVSPVMTFPKEENLDTGFGGFFNADIDLLHFLTLGVEGGYNTIKQESLDKNFNILMGGVSAGLYYYPTIRLAAFM